MRWRTLILVIFLTGNAVISHAGGPAFVAGSGYDPGVEGQALVWANGSVQYFTDQGDLSPILTGAQADALIATVFSTWTSVPGVALTAAQGGHLAEDVNGSNIVVAPDGTISSPADITSSAVGTPVGIVYDYDGTVTDALLGEGAGGSADCFTNAVYGGPDNFSAAGNIAHVLVVINGICAATNAQLPDVQYRLVRVLGRILGLGWSQANVNVLTRNPVPGSDDFAGFPVMHFADPISCVPISLCYNNAAVPKMDDMVAIARLYPAANPQPTGRIYGSVYFTDAGGNAVQQMQGVNVVARLMVSGQPSRQYVVTSVSGFAFCGNAGNIINGYVDGDGLRYDRWGSNDLSLEGFFDLGELPIPSGQTIAQYQLTVEALDPNWSLGVGPYAPTQVTPSGSFAPVVVTVTDGSNAERDILMLRDEIVQAHPGSGSTYANPGALPQGGAWGSWISGYGSSDFFEFKAQANRTASVSVTALDEAGRPTENKLLPVVGIWQLSDQSGNPAPAYTPSAFNSTTFAMTRLDAQFGVTDTFRVGVADFRGDGRPDYFYQASLLYSDTVTPARLSVSGGVTTLNGVGFMPGLQVSVGSSNASTLSLSASQIQIAVPAGPQDGTASIQVTNPVSGAFSQMIGALTYGALPTDLLLLLQGVEPATAVGSQAASPIRVRAVAADGVTPVNGATIAWSASGGLQLSACGGTNFCSVLSDEAGESSSWVTPITAGPSTVTILLAPASYSSPQIKQTTVMATSTTLDLAALNPTRWVGQGATIAVPLTIEVLNLGAPKAGVAVNFAVMKGATTLSAASATTNGAGFATVTAQITNQNGDVQVSACVAPNNVPCQTFTLFSTPPSLWALETVSGSLQIVPAGQSFQPLTVRVTDGSMAANPVMGVNVTFETSLARVNPAGGGGMPIILGSAQARFQTSQDGLASIVPSAGSVGPCEMFITATAGALTAQFQMESVAPIVPVAPPSSGTVPTVSQSPRLIANFASQGPAAQLQTDVLFAVPEIAPSNEPPADLETSHDSELSADDPSCDRSGSASPGPESKESEVSPPSAKAKTAKNDAPAMLEADGPREAAQAESGVAHAKAASPPEPEPKPASSSLLPEDKESCQVLADDGIMP
jgi:IPT/TIG domain